MPTLVAAINAARAETGAKQFDRAVNKIVDGSRRIDTSLVHTEAAMGRSGTAVAALTARLGPLLGAYLGFQAVKSTVQTMADFEKTLRTMQGVVGASAVELEALSAAARKTGETTRYSATAAAQALLELGRAGLSSTEAIAALPGVTALATSGQLDLARAAEVTTNVLAQFNLSAKESNRIADVFAHTANVSATSVAQMADAMVYVGPTAGALGISLEEVSAALGVLGDRGINASAAGTNLRGILTDLLNPTTEAEAALRAMGVALEDVDPAKHGLVDIFRKLGDAQLTAAEAARIFGIYNANAAVVLAGASKRIESFATANKAAEGSATELAQTMDDSLSGSFSRLVAAATNVAVTLGEAGLTDLLRGLVDGIAATVSAVSSLVGVLANFREVLDSLAGRSIDPVSKKMLELGQASKISADAIRSAAEAGNTKKQIEGIESLVDNYKKLREELGLLMDQQGESVRVSQQALQGFTLPQLDANNQGMVEAWQVRERLAEQIAAMATKIKELEAAEKAETAAAEASRAAAERATQARKDAEAAAKAEAKRAEERRRAYMDAADQFDREWKARMAARESIDAYIEGIDREAALVGLDTESRRAFTAQLEVERIAREAGIEVSERQRKELERVLERQRQVEAGQQRRASEADREAGAKQILLDIAQQTAELRDQLRLTTAQKEEERALSVEVQLREAMLRAGVDLKEQEITKLREQLQLQAELNGQILEQRERQAQAAQQAQEAAQRTFELGQTLADATFGILDGILFQAKSVKEAIADVLRDLSRLFLNRAFSNLAASIFPAPSAKGNVFDHGQITPFAYGGLVTGPTLFPTKHGLGLMGEEGTEAIMPLARDSSGRLGVRAQGGGTAITVNVQVGAGANANEFRRASGALADKIARSMKRRRAF